MGSLLDFTSVLIDNLGFFFFLIRCCANWYFGLVLQQSIDKLSLARLTVTSLIFIIERLYLSCRKRVTKENF